MIRNCLQARWLRLLSAGLVVPLLLLLSSSPAYAFNPGDASRQAWIAWMDQSTYLDFGKYPS